MKRLIWLVAWVFVALSCVRELPEPVSVGDAFPEGEPLTIQFTVPGVRYVPQTRSEDAPLPLGEDTDLYSMHLAIFGSSGYLKEYVKATDPEYVGNVTYEDPDGVERTAPGYRFTVTVSMSSKPRTVHFIGNGPETLPFGYEYEVIPELLSKRNQQAFWQMKSASLKPKEEDGEYVKVDGVYQPSDQTKADFKDIPLIRNWAKIEVSAAANSNFTLDGYALVNVPQYGTIAPYYVKENPGIDEDPHVFIPNYQNWTADELSNDFNYPAHLPDDTEFDYTIPAWPGGFVSDLTKPLYLYERPVPSANMKPSFVIVHGHYKNDDDPTENNDKDYFYKVDLMQDGVYYPIYRNFKYQIVIRKILSFGHTTAEAAAASAGSADVSADITTSHLADISDGEARLVVQPWMAHSFIRKQTNNKVLHVKFFDDMMSGQPNMDPSAVTLELLPMANSADDPVITEYFVGSPVYGLDTDKGWRTITFSTDEPSNKVRSQTLRVKGSYYTETTPPVLRQLYRDIVITLQPLQNMGLSCAWDEIDRGIGVSQQLYLHLPDDLIESMFPLDFIIEPEDMTLTPDNTMPNNNLPVISGTSISDHHGYTDKTVYQFKRTLTWSEYNDPNIVWPSQDLSGNAERLLCCYFKTTRRGNATTIWVANEFFNKNRVSYSNPLLPELKYFHVEGVDNEGCVVSIKKDNLEYQLDDEGWKPYTKSAEIKVRKGNRVYFRGSQTNWSGTDVFSATGRFKLGGNITSLVVGDAFETQGAGLTGVNLKQLFQNEVGLTDASSLELPMTNLTSTSFESMFAGCTALTAAPALPATTLSGSCYKYMFSGCSSLAIAPRLPAVTLAASCYIGMFKECTSLTTSPVLRAPTLVDNCYQYMFSGCTNLNDLTMYATNISASNCLNNWVANVAHAGVFHRDPLMTTLPLNSVSGIPVGWEDRPADEFCITAEAAGTVMYSGSGLQYSQYTDSWNDWADYTANTDLSVAAGERVRFRGTGACNGTFTSIANISVGGNIMSLIAGENYPAATSMPSSAFASLFKNAGKLVSARELILPTFVSTSCYQSMFEGCSSLTAAPELPATDLADRCYASMFKLATNLHSVKLSATSIGTDSFDNWLASVGDWGFLLKPKTLNLDQNSDSGVPTGWSPIAPFFIEARTDCTVTIGKTVSYIIDGDTQWQNYSSPVSLAAGKRMYIMATVNDWSGSPVSVSGTFAIGGDISSLVKGQNYGTEGASATGWTFKEFMIGKTKLVDASDLDLSMLTVPQSGYESMFSGCTGLKTPPSLLPATTLNGKAYYQMFYNCTALSSAPVFPHEESGTYRLNGENICRQMFYNCGFTALTGQLFNASTVLAKACFQDMFSTCKSLATIPEDYLPAITLAVDCYRGMFQSTALTTAPDLKAETLKADCYRFMFNSCSNLTVVRCWASPGENETYTKNWMEKTAATGHFYTKGSSVWGTGVNGIPANWTRHDDL